MTTKRTMYGLRVAVFVATAAAAAVTAATGAAETAHPTGCPSAYERLSVESFEAQGPYVVPRHIDEAGNNNGFVCSRPRPEGFQDSRCAHGFGNACLLDSLGLPLIHVLDDDNPAGSN